MTALADLARHGWPAAVAALISWAVLSLLLRFADRLPLDRPNARSLHARAVPRGAGLAIWAGWLAGSFWTPGAKTWFFPLLAVIAVSLLDDSRGVHSGVRLAVQTAAAALWVWLVSPSVPPLIAVVAIVWMANLYNFMDGSDGLAGTMTIAGFGAYAAAAFYARADEAGLLLALAAATVPFLYQNAPPARVFLGDVGAVPLGFLAAVFGLAGVNEGWWPLWFPPLAFLPFIADATITLVYRMLRRARIWEAHRDHYYQRLVRLGCGHTGTLKLYGALMLSTATSAVAVLVWAPQLGPWLTVGWSAVLALVYASIDYHWRRRRGQGIDESKC